MNAQWVVVALAVAAPLYPICAANSQLPPTMVQTTRGPEVVSSLSSSPQGRRRGSFTYGLLDKDDIWLRLTWKLENTVNFPEAPEVDLDDDRPKERAVPVKKIFLATYPHQVHGGQLGGYAMAEKACRDAGWTYFGDGGFRALLTTPNRVVSKVLPKHMHRLPVVNLRGESLAADWREFLDGKIRNSTLIAMNGTRDGIAPTWDWKYFWLGDGRGKTCSNWLSSYFTDVADVFAFDFKKQELAHDIASCSTSIYLLCYSVCDERNKFL